MKVIHLFVDIEGLGWDIVQDFSFMTRLLPYRSPANSVFSDPEGCRWSALTGDLPLHSKRPFFYFSGKKSSLENLNNRPRSNFSIGRNWIFRKCLEQYRIIKKMSPRHFQMFPLSFKKLSFFDYEEAFSKDLVTKIESTPTSVFNHWKKNGYLSFISDDHKQDEDNVQELIAALSTQKLDRVYLSLKQFAREVQCCGMRKGEILRILEGLERNINKVFQIAQSSYHCVYLNAFSSFSLSKVRYVSDLYKRFQKLGFRWGQDYVAWWDPSYVRFWFLGKEATQAQIRAYLSYQAEGYIVEKEELAAWGSVFAKEPYSELFYLLHPGSLFIPSFIRNSCPTAWQAYAPTILETRGCWMSRFPIDRPFSILDFSSMMKNPFEEPIESAWDSAYLASNTASIEI